MAAGVARGIVAAFNCTVYKYGNGGATGCAIVDTIFAALAAVFSTLWGGVYLCFEDKALVWTLALGGTGYYLWRGVDFSCVAAYVAAKFIA